MIGQKCIHCILRVHKNPNFTGPSYNYNIGFYEQIITYDRSSHIPIMLSLPPNPIFLRIVLLKDGYWNFSTYKQSLIQILYSLENMKIVLFIDKKIK